MDIAQARAYIAPGMRTTIAGFRVVHSDAESTMAKQFRLIKVLGFVEKRKMRIARPL